MSDDSRAAQAPKHFSFGRKSLSKILAVSGQLVCGLANAASWLSDKLKQAGRRLQNPPPRVKLVPVSLAQPDWQKVTVSVEIPGLLPRPELPKPCGCAEHSAIAIDPAGYQLAALAYTAKLSAIATKIQLAALEQLPWTPVLATIPYVSVWPVNSRGAAPGQCRISFWLKVPASPDREQKEATS